MGSGPWRFRGEPRSKIRTVLAIFGVEAGSFLRANPDGFTKLIPPSRFQSPDVAGSRWEWPDPESGRWLDLGLGKWTVDYVCIQPPTLNVDRSKAGGAKVGERTSEAMAVITADEHEGVCCDFLEIIQRWIANRLRV